MNLIKLDHMDVLIESAKAGYAIEDFTGAALTASALLFKSDPAVLGKIPLYRYIYGVGYRLFPESLTGDLRTEFYWTKSDGKPPGAEELAKVWEETGKKVRKRWPDVLK